MKVNHYQVYRPTPGNTHTQTKGTTAQTATKPGSFLNQLQNELRSKQTDSQLKISKHAEQRMAERKISISPEKWATISQKMNEAKSMGITDSLVLTDKEAMVVSAKNNTVITVMNRDEANQQIFSNINGTIILN